MRTTPTWRRRVLRERLYGAATSKAAVVLEYRSTRPPSGGAHFHGLHRVDEEGVEGSGGHVVPAVPCIGRQ